VIALEAAGRRGAGASLYVTLEPCSHHGRTPPCVDAIIGAGITKVVYGVSDPDPHVSGSGDRRLRDAGIEVEAGDGGGAVSIKLEAYLKHRRIGLPFVSMKYVASLDGKIAASSGDSRWVSGPATLAWAHELRTKIDAILVGVATIVVDNPKLTPRPGGVESSHRLLRVVLDSRGRTPPEADVLRGTQPTLIATTEASSPEWRTVIANAGAEVIVLPRDESGRVSLPEVLAALGSRGVLHLLVEGGGIVNGAFLDARLVDKIHAVIAPKIIGAAVSAAPVAGIGAARMAEAITLRDMTVARLGDDILFTGYPVYAAPEAKLKS
jgi:diaminohydroxyphosphoribosylaminopyrimidine deaminase/5-amino-6-(5-phosphoribosylamino)uracil reductase